MSLGPLLMDLNKLWQTIAIALLTWITYTTHNLVTDVAVIKSSLSEAANDRYTKTQAQLLEQRIDMLERQIREIQENMD